VTRTVDGNDLLAVRAVATELIAQLRAGDGPAYLECRTTRQRGHFEGDAQRYRPAGEVDGLRERDPITRLEAQLTAAGVSSNELAAITQEATTEMEAAAATARVADRPGPEVLTEDVYADEVGQRG
jgi:TPP-dependent pyruvate/acetoin dehydrogenase alpha subunit